MHRRLKLFNFGRIQTADIVVTWSWIIAFPLVMKTIQNILMTLLAGSQMSGCCPLDYFF